MDWQLLKKGVLPEKNQKDDKSQDKFTFYNEVLDEIISEEGGILNESEVSKKPGRNQSPKFGASEFAEKYLGKGKCLLSKIFWKYQHLKKTRKMIQF